MPLTNRTGHMAAGRRRWWMDIKKLPGSEAARPGRGLETRNSAVGENGRSVWLYWFYR